MEWLNYHHLMYFWHAAREGSVTKAAEKLLLAQPTVSGQIRELEKSVGTPLFERQGRGVVMTEMGQLVYAYADRIFTTGEALKQALADRTSDAPLEIRIGVADTLPRSIVGALLDPARAMLPFIRLRCRTDKASRLLEEVALHTFDLVLADDPMAVDTGRVFNHALGSSPVAFFGAPALAASLREGFPDSLDDAPLLASNEESALRRGLQAWFERANIRPRLVAEFDDSALMKSYGARGAGIFAAPRLVTDELRRLYDVDLIGVVPDLREQFYAITSETRQRHPVVVEICDHAREVLAEG